MKLKYKVDSIEGMDEATASLYDEKDGFYQLSVEGLDDDYVPKHKRDIERQHRKNAETKASEQAKAIADLQEKLEEMTQTQHKNNGDFSALKKGFDEKLMKVESSYKEEVSLRDKIIEQSILDAKANSLLAGKMKGHELFVDMVKRNARVEIEDGKANIRMLDKDGKISALNIDEWTNDNIINNKQYADFAIGSNASGSGANGANQGSGGAAKTIKSSEFYSKSDTERRELMKDGYKLT